ncbi:MAG: phosphoenolpyruvate carboxykinase (ATP) [Rhodobacteraceae bacterium]|nr:phosphoenolpyruvate carboxykinase (ATP) [Paracoccaceae bacterium]
MKHVLEINEIIEAVHTRAGILHQISDAETLIKLALKQPEVSQTSNGNLAVTTGAITGRAANDKFIVKDGLTADTVWWQNTGAMSGDHFDVLLADMLAHLEGKPMFRQQLQAGADRSSAYCVEVLSSSAWHALFIQNMLISPVHGACSTEVCILHLPEFKALPARHGTNSKTCIALDFSRNIVLICGTAYAGEIKKSVFSLFNYHAPGRGILPMHCAANVSNNGDTALFFGLSGTGKTTLSATPDRALIGDDEHGWSRDGVFNLEGGCYAKTIGLTPETEPEIYQAAQHPNAILENVVLVPETQTPDYADGRITENTRVSYPLAAIPNRVLSSRADTPKHVVLLTADAFGVLPPISRLTLSQAVYYFLSGYTAKIAGTEAGITEPCATFSACFGAPFMARSPSVYGALLEQRLIESGAQCWLVNTGWTGGPYGVGHRMPLTSTRRMLSAALSGALDTTIFRKDEIFGLTTPTEIPGVDPQILRPEKTWADRAAYKKQAHKLLQLFAKNFVSLAIPKDTFLAVTENRLMG